MPALPAAPNLPQSPEPTTNFVVGINVIVPPDTYGAVGTNHLTMTLNDRTVVHTRTGSEMLHQYITNFWTGTNINPYPGRPFDPRIVYDPFHARWISVAAVGGNPVSTSRMLLAVSQTPEPTNNWLKWEFKADTNNPAQRWADYPRLGFNKHWVVVQANMASSNFVSHFWVFNKTNLYAGNTNNFGFLTHADPLLAGNEAPAVMYDNEVSTMYLLQTANSNTNGYGWLRVFSITGAVDSAGLNTNLGYVQISDTWAHSPAGGHNYFAPQAGGSELIATDADSRIQSLVYRNGSLWAAQTVFVGLTNGAPSRSAIQWWQIKPEPLELMQVGRIDDPAGLNFYAFPSIAVNKFDDVLIGHNSFSTNQYASANISFRAFHDLKNHMRATRIFKQGQDLFDDDSDRWGDYSGTVVDPLNDSDFWTIQMYAGVRPVDTNFNASIVWAPLTVPLPANDHYINYVSISGMQGITNGTTHRALKEAGEPNHGGNAGGSSIWYNWTAPNSGQAVIDTIGSDFNTLLAVYTGTAVTNLSLVASNDNAGSALTSRVIFDAVSNTVYRIALDGYNGDSGTGIVTWCQSFAPVIVSQPESTNVVANANENATFSVLACGIPSPLAYQWRFKHTNSLATTTNIVDATNSSYTIGNVQGTNAGSFSVVVTNSSGSVTSSVASLIVHGDSAARLTNSTLVANAFRIHISGVTNRPYVVQTTTNLNSPTNWSAVYTNFVSFWYTNSPTTSDWRRFYRVITNN